MPLEWFSFLLLLAGSQPDFPREVLPLLKEHCFRCHSHAAGKSKGGVVLDSRVGLTDSGDSVPPLNLKNPSTSLLLQVIRHAEGVPAMPPGKRLEPGQVAVLSRWVESGAPWPAAPADLGPPLRRPGSVTAADREWWSVQPISSPSLTTGKVGPDAYDRLVLTTLAARKLQPAPAAEPSAWLRRVHLDLTGLPPTPKTAREFLAVPSREARERVVDTLLASPAYGEKWGRLWLDLVRYADSDGYRQDEFRPQAWRYRDWVVGALNADMPYDRFLRLQLAADELEPNNALVQPALGYLRLGTYEYNQRDSAGQWDTILDEITDVTSDVMLGLGLACARCHDHKYDPLRQRDYHALRAYFTALAWPAGVATDATRQVEQTAALARWRIINQARLARLQELEAPARAKARAGAIEKFPPEIQKLLKADPATLGPRDRQVRDLAWRQVDYEYDHLENHFPAGDSRETWRDLYLELSAARPKAPETVLVAADIAATAPSSSFTRRGKTEAVLPATPLLLDRLPEPVITPRSESTGRRSALATWITRPDHPLTARVMVNRVWAALLGNGIVSTTSDFGTLGDRPSHPALLDLLAADFIAGGWKLKPLIRRVVLGDTYSRSSNHANEADCRLQDPDNRLLWRGPFRRLTAEEIRDGMLAASGKLDHAAGGPTVAGDKNRRSLYLPFKRNNRDQFLAAFDAADGVLSTPLRQNTITVVQTLLLRNGTLTSQSATGLASLCAQGDSGEQRATELYLRALGRPASPGELSIARDLLRQGGAPGDAELTDLAAAVLQSNAYLYLD